LVVLPKEIAKLASKWNFEPTEELEGGFCSRVFASDDLVLKVPFQGEEAISGWKMAVLLSGNSGPIVHQYEESSGALLMDRIKPGTKLSDSGESEQACFGLFRAFRNEIAQLPTSGLMHLSNYFSNPTPLVKQLLETTKAEVALHGDLHHENIILGKAGWTVIDPKGLAGDSAFEAAAFMHNPGNELLACDDLDSLLSSRIRTFADMFGWDPWRIWGWSVAIFDNPVPPDDPWTPIRDAMIRVEPPSNPK
jgi:streptomycin 6-kinase